jgi:glycosyltransferase involved in cell wall biosynthesis
VTGRPITYVVGATAGGTGRHVVMLAAGCAAAGLHVCVCGPAWLGPQLAAAVGKQAGDRGRPASQRPQFEVVPIGTRPRPGKDAAAVRLLRAALRRTAPSVVHAHGLRAGALAALALRPFPGSAWPGGRRPALVVTVHNAPPPGRPAAAGYGALERLVARRADVVLCVSADLTARIRRLGAREVGRALVPAPAAVPTQEPGPCGFPAAWAGGDRRPVVLAAGRLTAQKGLDTLVAAAASWRGRRPEPVLAVAGTGPLAGPLARQAAALRVDARFLGWRDDLPALLAAADVFVLPSRWEGQPLVLQEALRAGRPVVAADVGGVREVTGDAALLVPPGDPQALAAAVLRVLDDARLARGLAEAAAARARELPGEAEAVAAAIALYERLS